MAQDLLSSLRQTVEKNPMRLAVVEDNRRLSYSELGEQSELIGLSLRELGVGADTVVGIFLDRSLESVLAFVGVLKAGGVFLPLDPDDPQDRVAKILEETGAQIMLTAESLKNRMNLKVTVRTLEEILSDGKTLARLDRKAAPQEGLAFILPTSASTGTPKGVMITRSGLDAFVKNGSRALEIDSDDVCLHAGPLTFSAGVRQSLMPLRQGATIAVADRTTVQDPLRLWEFIRKHRVTFLDFVPSYWSAFIEALSAASDSRIDLDSSIERVASVGELLPWSVPEDWTTRLGQKSRFLNLYGHTETTGLVSVYEVKQVPSRKSVSVPVGQAIAETDLLILDDKMQQVPVGESGELYVRSPSAMRGYLNGAALTEQQLVADRFSTDADAKLCRTGDLARWLSSGDLEIIGRADDQIKIGGRRLDLREVESALLNCPGIRSAAVVNRTDPDGPRGLSAYVVPRFKNLAIVGGHRRQPLPNGLAVAIQNPSGNGVEALALYEEIWLGKVYHKYGITIPSQGTVVDVGANIGMFSLFAGLHYPQIRLYCFEPVPAIYEVLRLNLKLYGLNAKTFNEGMADSKREVSFTYYR